MRVDYTKYIKNNAQTESQKNNGGVLGGIGYAGEKAAVGLVSGVEGVWDFLAGGTASLFGADKWAERQFANDWFGDWYSHPEEWYNPGQGWKVAGDVTGAIGQMAPSILAAVGIMAIPGVGPAMGAVAGAGGVGSAIASGAVTAGEIALALLPAATSSTIMGLSAAGSATKDAYRTTGQLTGKEYGYGALVGVTEGAVEMASAGLAKGSGKVISSIGNAVYRNTAKQTVGTVAKTSAKALFKEAAGNFFWEAVEEGASEFLAPIYQRMTYDPNARNATGQEIAYAALVGGLTGVVMNGMQGGISNAYNAVTATAAGNRAVQNGTAPKILENGRIIAEYQGKNNTAIEVFARATETYNKLTASLSKTGGQITTQAQKRMLGELNRDIVGAVYSTGVYKSAQNYVLNAEALAERISNLGLRDNNGRLVSITAEQLTEGVDMSDLSSPKGVERFQKTLQKAMSQNPVLSWLALNDAVGHILTDTNKIAEAMSVGQSVSRADISRLIEEGSQEDIDAVTSSLGITEDDLRRMSPEELDARGYEFAQTEKGRAIYEANAMFQSVIDGKEGLKKRVSKVIRKDMRDGSYRIEGEGLDVAVIKKGDSYYLYDYKTRRRSRALSLQEANKWLKEARSSEVVSKPTETKKTALREETEQIDAFARENIDNYKNLLSAQKQAVRSTIRQARALGVSEARTLLAARVAARSGMAVIFDTVRTGKSNALYDKGKLFIKPEITEAQIYEAILGHEMGHALFDTSRAGKKLMADVLKRIEKSEVISQDEVAKVRERYTDHYKRLGVSESRYKPIVDEEVAMAYMEKIIGVDGAWDYILSKDATWADKVLSFFRKADKDYADIPKMSAEARRFLKRYKQVFSRLDPSGKVVDYSSLGSGSMRHSISSFAEATGLKAAHDENGLLVFLDKDGNKVTKITTEHVKSSPLGLMIGIAVDDKRITAEEAGKQYEGVAELFQLIIQTQDPEMVWQFSGAMMFSSVKKNADAQYTTTIDFSTVCRKTQEMIEGMTHLMKKKKRGLTIEEVTRLQKKISEAGGTVPCPVCYVFSRWAGVGGILDNIKRMQTKYEKYNTEQLNQALKDAYDAAVRQVKEIHGRTKKANTKIITELLAEKSEGLTTLQSRLEGLIREKDSGKVITKDGKSIFKAIQMLQKDIDALTVEVDVLSEYSWLGMVRLKKNYKPVPDDVLFDLADPTVFAEEYKDTWKFRTTRGPSAGKAILPYSDFRVGDVISGANVKSKTKVDEDTEEETIISRNKTWAEIGETLSKPQKDQVKKAIARAAAQNLIGGQRMQSTSDFRYDYALDYIMAFFEMQAIGSNIQTYTKMVEFVDLVCSVGGDCNMSLMGKDAGYENGKLIFSDVTGMDFETAKRARAKYDNAQTILVGINDEHIRLALLDSEETLGAYVDFVIPYHASGAKTEFIKTLVENLGEKYNKRNYVDYSDVQTDKSKFAEKSVPEDVERMRSLREMILTGKRGKSKFVITDEELSFLREMKEKSASLKGKSFAALRAIEQKAMAGDPKAIEEFKSWSAGVLYDTYMRVRHTESKKETKPTLTKSQAKAIMPHEYWDRSSTRKTAYINGFIFRSYCYSLGFKPRFSGNTKKDVYYGDFTNETGYWKLLIDRPMYDRKGRYREQQACNMTNFDMQMALPSYGQRVWGESKIPEPNLERAHRVADEFLAELPNREVTEAVDTERRSLSDDEYLSAVEKGDMETAQRMVDEAARNAGYTLHLYHGTGNIFYVFNQGEQGIHFGTLDQAVSRIRAKERQFNQGISGHSSREIVDNIGEYPNAARASIIERIYYSADMTDEDAAYAKKVIWDGEEVSDERIKEILEKHKDFEYFTFTEEQLGHAFKGRLISAYVKAQHPLEISVDLDKWTPNQLAALFEASINGTEFSRRIGGKLVTLDPQKIMRGISLTKEDLPAVQRLYRSNDFSDVAKFLYSKGLDSIKYLNEYEGTGNDESYILLSSNQVKSADPVTYDSKRNPIPLSRRFNEFDPDIRYSLSDEWEEAEARSSQGGRSFLDELFFPEEEDKINYEEVLKHPPRKPGIAKITRGQAKKTIANHTLRKVYSLEETRKIVSGIYQIEHLKKKDFEYISQIVWQVLNEAGGMQIDHRTHLFERTAQYIVAKLIFDTKVDNTKSQEYTQLLERMSVLGMGIQKLDFGRAEAELRNLLDKDYAKFATRWRNKGYIGLPIDSWVQELSTVDGSLSYLSDMHPADALVEIDRIYTETKSELMDTKTVSALEDLQPEYYKELETEIYSLLVQAWNKGGTRSAFASTIEPLESRIKFLTSALSESREYNTYTNLCLKYVEKLKAEKNGKYLRATDYRGDDPSHPIFALNKIVWNGGVVNAVSVGTAVATFNKWYASKEAQDILGTEDGLWSEKIAELAGELGATRFGKKDKLTLAQLKDLSTILAHANAIVRNLTRQYRNGQLVAVSDEAYGSYDIVADNARILGDSVFSGGAFGYTRETSDPSTLVKKWDGYNPDGLFTKTFADIRRGEIDAEYEKMRILSEMDDFLHDHKKFLDTERTKTVEIDINGRKHKLTRMELIGLYMTSLRDQSIRGLAYSGVVFERRVGKGAKRENKIEDIPPLFSGLVSDEEMFLRVATFSENLRKELTADEQTYVGILEHIYQECKTLKATTDIQRLGFTNVLDGYYYPIKRYDAGRIEGVVWSHQDAEMALHISANKSTNAKASATLLIGDPDQVMTKHLNSVASYHFLSAPIELYNRVLSYNLDADVDNNERGRFKPGSGQSLRRVISEQAGGRKALQYFNDLLVAVQGGKVTNEGRGAEFISMSRGGYAVSALALNPKVLLTQFSALVASINELDPRWFVKGIWKSSEGVDNYCHLAAIRNYENAAALAMTVDDLNSSSKKFHRMTMQLGNKLMKGVGAMDRLVITRLFGVCQVQVEKNGGAKVGTEENRIEAGKLLEKVILETQQNALPTERSDWMRNGNLITKTATMFSADAMKSRGRLQDAWGECRVLKKRISAESDASVVSNLKKQLEKAKKKTATALAAIVIQSAYMAVIAEAFKWLYDKDEENRWDLPKWANFLIDVAAGCFGGMPLIRDIVDFFVDGFELDNFALDALNGILTTTQEFIDRVTDYEHTSSENWMLWMKNLTFTVGSLCGLPTRNLYNLVVGLTKRISPETGYKIDGFFKSQNHRDALEQAFEDADSDMIFTIIDSAYKDIFGEKPDETTTHSIAGLARDYDIFPRRMESLDEYPSMSISQQKQFKEIYSQSWDALEGIGNNPQWLREDDETKAEIVRCVFDIYFDKACIAVLNKTVSDSDAKRVLLSEYIDPFAVAYASKAGEKKEDLIKKLKGYPNLTNAERTMLYGLRYKLSDADSSVVAGYINKMYATRQEKQLFAQIYGLYYNDRTGRVSPIKK